MQLDSRKRSRRALDDTASNMWQGPSTWEAMWQELRMAAVEDRKLVVAQRCSAALGDVAKVGQRNFTPGSPQVDPRLTPG